MERKNTQRHCVIFRKFCAVRSTPFNAPQHRSMSAIHAPKNTVQNHPLDATKRRLKMGKVGMTPTPLKKRHAAAHGVFAVKGSVPHNHIFLDLLSSLAQIGFRG